MIPSINKGRENMKTPLFGASIETSCEYCQNSVPNGSEFLCSVGKAIKNGKCRKFKYNPTMRKPKGESSPVISQKFTPEDFML